MQIIFNNNFIFKNLKVNVHQIMDPDNQVLIEGEYFILLI